MKKEPKTVYHLEILEKCPFLKDIIWRQVLQSENYTDIFRHFQTYNESRTPFRVIERTEKVILQYCQSDER